jgi:hypothetical protein
MEEHVCFQKLNAKKNTYMNPNMGNKKNPARLKQETMQFWTGNFFESINIEERDGWMDGWGGIIGRTYL